jgi:hypothetical protein
MAKYERICRICGKNFLYDHGIKVCAKCQARDKQSAMDAGGAAAGGIAIVGAVVAGWLCWQGVKGTAKIGWKGFKGAGKVVGKVQRHFEEIRNLPPSVKKKMRNEAQARFDRDMAQLGNFLFGLFVVVVSGFALSILGFVVCKAYHII